MIQSLSSGGRRLDEPLDRGNASLYFGETLVLDSTGKVGQLHEGIEACLGICHPPQQVMLFAFPLKPLQFLEKPAHFLCFGRRDPRSLENGGELFADRPQIALHLENPAYPVWIAEPPEYAETCFGVLGYSFRLAGGIAEGAQRLPRRDD